MIRIGLILVLTVGALRAVEEYPIKIDASVLAVIPTKRHAALVLFEVTDRDSIPAIDEKKAKYIEALKSLIQDLRGTYYWHSEFPNGIDEAIEKRAVLLAGLRYPASPTTGASAYGDLIQGYTILMYEEEIVTIAHAVCERFKDRDIVIIRGEAQAFSAWKKAWDKAGEVKDGANQHPPEPHQQ